MICDVKRGFGGVGDIPTYEERIWQPTKEQCSDVKVKFLESKRRMCPGWPVSPLFLIKNAELGNIIVEVLQKWY